ncbi:TatD family hydrolase [Mycoplasma leonicaptivi]|uniref:TatD family hydrolase n=1 Tax=Mycoplasma leonicaptivi TaxID=36742 RepID=UPI00048390B3|nr:TatD family hydrolase [Mycoplasma leonicaptivi]
MSKKFNKFIDAHCHINSSYYGSDDIINEILIASEYNRVDYFINNGGHIKENLEIIELSKKFPKLLPCIGVHPEQLIENSIISIENEVEKHISNNPTLIKGIGEIGIDYFYENSVAKEIQIAFFEQQIELANKYDLPAVIHIRDKEDEYNAYEDVFNILKKYPNTKCMLHTFAGNLFWLDKFKTYKNLYFSYSGVCTFGSSSQTREVIKNTPIDKLLIETDSPYLRVHPYTGEKNEPNTIVYVAYYVAGLLNIGMDKFVDKVNKNTRKLFNL